MKNKNRIIILGLISALVLCACGGNAGMKEYKSKDGWTVSYDKKMFSVNEGNGSVDFVYTGESAGTNMVEISYIPDKQPEEALAEITDTWGEDADISRIEGFFPGTSHGFGIEDSSMNAVMLADNILPSATAGIAVAFA